MSRLVLLATLVLLALPAPAGASLMPLPPRFEIHETDCPDDPDVAGCADVESGDVYVPSPDRFAKLHELGHVFDAQVLTDPDREWLARKLGFAPGTPWHPATDDVVESPNELFADAYATCAMGLSPAGRVDRRGRLILEWPGGYGYLPSARQHRRVCNGIVVLGLVRAGQR